MSLPGVLSSTPSAATARVVLTFRLAPSILDGVRRPFSFPHSYSLVGLLAGQSSLFLDVVPCRHISSEIGGYTPWGSIANMVSG